MSERYEPFVLCGGHGMLQCIHFAGVYEGLLQAHFSAGEKGGVLDSLRAVRTSSGSAPSALFSVLAQSMRNLEVGIGGRNIYLEELTERDFLNLWRIPDMVIHRLRSLFTPFVPLPSRVPQVVNIGYLMDIFRRKLPADYAEQLRKLPFEYSVDVFDRNRRELRSVSLRTAPDPLQVIHDGISAIPGYQPPDEQQYVDAAVAQGFFPHEELRTQYPKEKIVYVANYPLTPEGVCAYAREWLTHLCYGVLSISARIGPQVYLDCFHRAQAQVRAIRADTRALLVQSQQILTLLDTTKRGRLERLLEEGRRQCGKILHFLATPNEGSVGT